MSGGRRGFLRMTAVAAVVAAVAFGGVAFVAPHAAAAAADAEATQATQTTQTTTAAGAANRAGGYDYPTEGRVEYVLSCMDDNGHDFANVYKCSCVIDRMAAALPYDEFVDQSTFSKYATLGGEGGAEFRVDHAKSQTKKFRALQVSAYQACGLGAQHTPTVAK